MTMGECDLGLVSMGLVVSLVSGYGDTLGDEKTWLVWLLVVVYSVYSNG